MGLGNRTARSHHSATAHEAVRSEDFADYQVDERVHTVDGIGRVLAYEDGPFPGTEKYQIELEGGRGGGWYATREVYSSAGMTEASVERTAAEDYPELGRILHDRPDIARTGSRRPFVHEARKPADLGPEWLHSPSNGYEPERYDHHDLDKEMTHSIVRRPGMRSDWEMHAKHWRCGTTHVEKSWDRVPDPSSLTQDGSSTSGSRGIMSGIGIRTMNHIQKHHDAQGGCDFDPNKSEEENASDFYNRKKERA